MYLCMCMCIYTYIHMYIYICIYLSGEHGGHAAGRPHNDLLLPRGLRRAVHPQVVKSVEASKAINNK